MSDTLTLLAHWYTRQVFLLPCGLPLDLLLT